MEDKRTLLAFLLIGLILLVLPYYYEWMGLSTVQEQPVEGPVVASETEESFSSPSREKTESRGADARRSTLAERPEARSANSSSKSVSPAAIIAAESDREFQARLIRVRTPLQEITFSTLGGEVVSVRMARYDREEGEAVELVPEFARGLTLSLRPEGGGRGSGEDLGRMEFVPDREFVEIGEGEEATLRLRADLDGGRYVEKELHFYGDRYGVDLKLNFSGFDEQTFAWLGWEGGIERAEREASVDLQVMRAVAYANESVNELRADEDESQYWPEEGVEAWSGGRPGWAGVNNKYFFAGLAPTDEGRHWVELGSGAETGGIPRLDYRIGSRLSAQGSVAMLFYIGPLDYEEVIRYEVELERAMDLGWPIVREISKLLLVLFVAAHAYIPNYGFVIILFAVGVKGLVYPLTHKSFESTARMQELQPKIAALKEKFKNDNQRLSRETMKLYKDEGVNPLGGCLPMVLQMPIFIAMYSVFRSTIELRQASFILWIEDLSLPDEILIAGIGIHVLPVLMSGAMFFQSKMTMKDPKQAALVYIMPAVMVVIMWDFSSGLVLYWTVFNVLQIGQQYLTNHLKKARQNQAASAAG